MNIFFAFIIIFLVFIATMLVRNEIVHHNIMKAIVIIYSRQDWRQLSEKYLVNVTRRTLLFNPTLWTFDQMFPGLNEK